MLFLMELTEEQRVKFFGTVVSCLIDFTELNPAAPVASFLQVFFYVYVYFYVLRNGAV